MEELTIDGVWKHRPNELLPVEYEYLNDAAKNNYIFKIQQIPEQDRSTYESIIYHRYVREQDFKKKNVRKVSEDFSLTSTEESEIELLNIAPDILDEDELIKNIPNLRKLEIREKLEIYYGGKYPKWEFDLYQSKDVETFIHNTWDYYKYSSYIIGLLTTYRKL